MKCPTCGHTPTTKRQTPIAVVDVDSLNDTDFRAHCTRVAPYADVQFMIANSRGLSLELLSDARALAATVDAAGRFVAGMTRASFYRQYYRLSARRREERDAIYWRRVIVPARTATAWAAMMAPGSGRSIGSHVGACMAVRYVTARHSAQYPEAQAA